VARQAFPIALPHDLFESVIDTICVHGSVTCDLRGYLRFLPDAAAADFATALLQ
jgi:hypothetical protein